MHHLGHAFLAAAPPAFRFGAIIADGVRGQKEKQLPSTIQAGIAFHREIDYKTDRHSAFIQARQLLRPACGRYAGIFVDLWLDAVLGENWPLFSSHSLPAFIEELRSSIRTYRAFGPSTWQNFFEAALHTDLLFRFASYEGMLGHIRTFIERRRLPLNPSEAILTLQSLQSSLEPLLVRFWREALTWQRSYTPL